MACRASGAATVADMPRVGGSAIEDGACRGFDQIRARPPSAPAAARGGRTR